ncbi:MAG: tetratricopeptide repeat protein [Terriglobales bacterium]
MGMIYSRLGDYDKALSAYQQGLRLDPGSGIGYQNVVSTYTRLDRLDEAKATIQEAKTRGFDSPLVHFYSYNLAFLQQDAAGMEARQIS